MAGLGMTKGEALRMATGYAWGHQDGSGTPTAASCPPGDGAIRFGMAFADRQVAYNKGEADFMPSVQSAYRAWQLSGGKVIA